MCIKYIDLFGGIGGFSEGIRRAKKDWKCIGYYEINKYAVQTYNKNFGTNYKPTDITRFKTEQIPDFDVLCAGFPCQAFSIAGKREGFNDTRGTLFFEIVRIAKSKRPRILFLENVKGLLSHDEGRTFRIILKTLDELGYDVQWQMLNSKHFDVPQNRERVFIIGHLRGTSRPEVFPIKENRQKVYGIQGQQTNTFKARYRADGDGSYIIESKQYAQKVKRCPLKFLQRNQKKIEGDYAFTVDTMHTGGVMIDDLVRRFTPTEIERLQSFPDGWTDGVSDTQRYKQLGNAVTVNVIEAVVKKFKV